ncbi:MAG: hypothetical protein NC084_08245 [Bacteroides sp.]|nr:hypothetical protein [Eubacterium sp.]MCM1418632.1 hypothetical protein [Roseburia sp.]MCM1462686.1 hypothetical protein [Bacteroides sp.]
MKKKKILAFVAPILLLSACSSETLEEWKDDLIGAFNGAVEFVGKCALTGDLWLKGTRETGEDDYNGSYFAEYSRYNGEEYLFGGTSLLREGEKMTVAYTIGAEGGSVRLYRVDGEHEYEIAVGDAEGVYEFSVSAGDNFIILKGENFTGRVALAVETENEKV